MHEWDHLHHTPHACIPNPCHHMLNHPMVSPPTLLHPGRKIQKTNRGNYKNELTNIVFNFQLKINGPHKNLRKIQENTMEQDCRYAFCKIEIQDSECKINKIIKV